jgi:hypothetical protein
MYYLIMMNYYLLMNYYSFNLMEIIRGIYLILDALIFC